MGPDLEQHQRDRLLAILDDARSRGFLGPGPIAGQLEHALAFVDLLPAQPVGVDRTTIDALDLGSGGGVPALVLATVVPGSRWTLVDAMARRTAFLSEAVRTLELADRVEVVTSRAEALEPRWRGRFDVVTARGFGPPPVIAECAAPWVRIGGSIVVSEPPGAPEGRWPAAGLSMLGLELGRVVTGPPAFVRLDQRTECPSRYPRRIGVPAKRPLW